MLRASFCFLALASVCAACSTDDDDDGDWRAFYIDGGHHAAGDHHDAGNDRGDAGQALPASADSRLAGPVVRADDPPPPISGGSLTVLRDGRVFVADPDRDRLVLVDLMGPTVEDTITLEPGAEPGRSIEDAEGRVHVVLRGSDQVATFDPATHALVEVRDTCAMPRGIAHDPGADVLYVACRTGELMTLPVLGGPVLRRVQLVPDLRDVVIEGGRLWVSTFRRASVLLVAPDGSIEHTVGILPVRLSDRRSVSIPSTAWRTIPNGGEGGVLVLHQMAGSSPVDTGAGGYSSSPMERCPAGGIVTAAVTVVSADGVAQPSSGPLAMGSVVVDIARRADGTVTVASAGTRKALEFEPDALEDPFCAFPNYQRGTGTEAIAVGYDADGQQLILSRDGVLRHEKTAIDLGGELREDTGHAIFHLGASTFLSMGGGIACASCHPEGAEDGHVWDFTEIGPRRTQSLEGGLSGTEPFHWNGDMASMNVLAAEVFTRRMGGVALEPAHTAALLGWIDSIPAPTPTAPAHADASAAVERGRALFMSTEVGCATCHSGARFTNNATVDVGTGGPLQVPSLVGVSFRTPLMHNGCAATLANRFDRDCGGSDDRHGVISHLGPAERSDLTAYLGTL